LQQTVDSDTSFCALQANASVVAAITRTSICQKNDVRFNTNSRIFIYWRIFNYRACNDVRSILVSKCRYHLHTVRVDCNGDRTNSTPDGNENPSIRRYISSCCWRNDRSVRNPIGRLTKLKSHTQKKKSDQSLQMKWFNQNV
jgi:hypothetical protein